MTPPYGYVEALIELKPRFLRWASARGFNEVEAEDLVQDTFVAVHEKLHQYDSSRAHLKSWIFGFMHRTMLERRKRNAQRSRLADMNTSIDEVPDGFQPPAQVDYVLLSQVDAVMRGMSPHEQTALRLASYGSTTAEIGSAIGMTQSGASVVVRRARAKLGEVFDAAIDTPLIQQATQSEPLANAKVARAPKVPTCHPDRPHQAKGLCSRCYKASRPKTAKPAHRSRNAETGPRAKCHAKALHYAHGLCAACTSRLARRAKKAGVRPPWTLPDWNPALAGD